MPTLGTIADLVKKPLFFIAVVVVFILLLLAFYFLTSLKTTPSWNGITPEVSTEADAKSSLGEPKKQQELEDFKILGYKSDFENRLHEVWVESGKVVLIKEQINPKDKKNIKSFKDLSGPIIKLYSEEFADAQVLNFYESEGLAILTNKNTGLVNEIWYFKPTEAASFVKRFDPKLTPYEPFRFN